MREAFASMLAEMRTVVIEPMIEDFANNPMELRGFKRRKQYQHPKPVADPRAKVKAARKAAKKGKRK